MARTGQISRFGGMMPAEAQPESKTFTVIDNEGYTLKLRKTWVPISDVWHIQFLADISGEDMRRHEYFLTDTELAILRIAL